MVLGIGRAHFFLIFGLPHLFLTLFFRFLGHRATEGVNRATEGVNRATVIFSYLGSFGFSITCGFICISLSPSSSFMRSHLVFRGIFFTVLCALGFSINCSHVPPGSKPSTNCLGVFRVFFSNSSQ